MRFKSPKVGGFRVFAVAGVNTISFGIEATTKAKKGLLGFSVERFDPQKNERFTMPGFKVFKSVIPNPGPHLQVSTFDQPVQSFLWDDFTAGADHAYEYTFQPLRGKPKNLDRSAKPITTTSDRSSNRRLRTTLRTTRSFFWRRNRRSG